MQRRATSARGQAWARDYVDAIVQRDVRHIASIDKRDHQPRLLQALAQHSGGIVLYDGEQNVPFGGRLVAAPLWCLWSDDAEAHSQLIA